MRWDGRWYIFFSGVQTGCSVYPKDGVKPVNEYIDLIIRSVIAFAILLAGSKLLGKQTISQMNIFDFIASITLGAITANLTFNSNIKIHHHVIAFFMFVGVILATAYISMWSQKSRTLFAGDPTVVIQNGKILEKNMRSMRYTADYLNQQLREKDIFNIEEVLFAIIETNGELTVLKKPQFRQVTKQDLWLSAAPESKLPIELVMDRKIKKDNLKENQLTESWLMSELQKQNTALEEVFYAVLLPNGKVYIDTYKDHIQFPVDKE